MTAWLIVMASLAAAPRAAQAQTLNRAPLWAVVPFGNTSGYGGSEVGVQAADGFVVELSKTNKYDVVSRADTNAAIANDDLVEPLDNIGLQKLSRDLGSDAVATGTVETVTFSDNPRRATVSVVVEVVDRISGELINGAVASGTSTPRPIPTDDDTLVNQAVENADFDAVRQITTFNLPRATVLLHRDPGTVTLNKGTQDGIFDGLSMLVTRNGSEVGRVQVSDATADESDATVTEQGLGIQPQDVATAIYHLPPFSIGPDHRLHVISAPTALPVGENNDDLPHNSTRQLFSGVPGILLGIGAAVAAVALATNGASGTSEGTNAIGGGRTGGATAEIDQSNVVSLFGLQAGTAASDNSDFVPLRIHVVFSPGQLGGNPGTIQYHVYRSPQPSVLSATNFGTSTLLDDIGSVPAFSPASPSNTYDSAADLPAVNVYKPYSVNDHELNNAFFYGVTTTTTTTTTGTGGTITASGVIPDTGLNIGDRVQYAIEGLYDVPDLTTGTSPAGTTVSIGSPQVGTTNTTTNATTTGSTTTTTGLTTVVGLIYSLSELVYSNYVTYLQPVILRSTNAAVYPFTTANQNSGTPAVDSYFGSAGPRSVVVTVDEVYGGTASVLDYALEFSTDPSFNSNVARYTTTAPNSGDGVNFRRGPAFSFGSVDLTSISQFQNARAIYVRVGVRDQRNGSDENVNPYIYSTADPANSSGGVLPSFLLPSNATVTTLARAAVATNGVPILTPKFTFIPHRQSIASGVDSAAIQVPGAHPWMTPSQTPHAGIGTTAHPTVGNPSGSLRPTR